MTAGEGSRRYGHFTIHHVASTILGLTIFIAPLVVFSGEAISKLFPYQLADTKVRRRLSESLPNGGCFVTPSVAAPPDIRPVFSASYPGSGARMTWNLIEAITGIVTGDDWNTNGWGKQVVSVKTHYPHPHGNKLSWEAEIERAFIVVRSPIKAIPSFHNFLHEFQNNLENHSLRAPVEDWIRWRDNAFSVEVKEWRRHLEYYLARFPANKRLVVSYEDLTNENTGPRVSKQIIRFFAESPGVTPISEESAECVWGTVVNYQSGKQYNTRKPLDKTKKYVGAYPIWPGSKRRGDKERPLTQAQIDEVREMLQEVKILARDMGERDIQYLMQRYIDEIKTNVKPDPRTAADLPPTHLPVALTTQQQQKTEISDDIMKDRHVPTPAETLATKDRKPRAWSVNEKNLFAAGF